VVDIIHKSGNTEEIESASISELKNKLQGQTANATIRSFKQKIIDGLKAAKKFGSASCYKKALEFVNRLIGIRITHWADQSQPD
jgi:hypothetical protein